MIKDIRIQNYKLFKDFTVKNLPRIFLISGKNNCGKTSLLEAIFFPLDHLNPDMFTRLLRFRGVDFMDMDFIFTSSYHHFKAEQSIIFEYTVNSSKRKWQYNFLPPSTQPLNIHNGNIVELQNNQSNNLGGIQISHWLNKKQFKPIFLIQTQSGLSLNVTQPELYNHNTPAVFMSSFGYGPSVAENATRYGNLDRNNNTDNILLSLQILEPKLKSLSVIPIGNQPALHGDIGMEKKVHLNLMGQGIARLISILLGISEAQNGVMLIDELENGFHHSILPRVWEVIAKHAKLCNTQIIATTHSWELISSAIEGLPKDLRSDFQYRRLERNKKDQFKTVDYEFDSLKNSVQSGFETR